MSSYLSDHESLHSDDEVDVRTPQSSPAKSQRALSPAASVASSVDNVADLIARRRALEEQEDSDNDDQDTADIYAQMKQRLMGGVAEKKTSPKVSAKRASPAAKTASPSPTPARRQAKATMSSSASERSSRSSPAQASLQASDSDSDVPVVARKRAKPTQLFQSDSSDASGSESEASTPGQTDRLQQLIQRRRQERQRKEEEEAARKAEQDKRQSVARSAPPRSDEIEPELEETAPDPINEDIMPQQSRPTRKASKKAIEEMNKETQRLNRNMQLTHQAKVKTKFSIADFAARFARPSLAPQEAPQQAASSSVHASSDVEAEASSDTPPSSPPSVAGSLSLGKSIFSARTTNAPEPEDDDEDLPTMEEILTQCMTKVDKGKAPMPRSPSPVKAATKLKLSPRQYRITPIVAAQTDIAHADSSDEELDVVRDRLTIFDEVKPNKALESRAHLHLRFLAGMNNQEVAGKSKNGKNSKPTVTAGQLDAQLLRRAALQAKQEREQKIAELLAKGIVVQSAEERERDQMQIEDLLEKARAEADQLRKKEKMQAKKDGGEMDLEASSDESDDEEWMEEKSDDGAELAEEDDDEDEDEQLALSGSEDEEELGDEDEEAEPVNGLIDEAAEETDAEPEEDEEVDVSDADEESEDAQPKRRVGRKKFVVDDDEDEDDDEPSPTITATPAPATQASADTAEVDDIAAAFGFNAGGKSLISPSQLFAGTMGASQSQEETQPFTQDQDSMDLFNRMVPMSPGLAAPQAYSQDDMDISTPLAARTDYSQTIRTPVMTGFSQVSTIPTPSQDMGFGHFPSQIRREVSVSVQSMDDTQDTEVLLPVPESPVVQKKGRLQRRRVADEDSGDEEVEPQPATAPTKDDSAFELMRKAAAKPAAPDFDKKKSNAKNMVDEQAEESEDEYAGLGGASDDDSDADGDEFDKAIIDESEVHVDERKMAAFYAEKARVDNEAQTSKLYKDIMSGALRRQRGDAFDLDEDEDEQRAEQRRRRQREEARKRRLLLGDENLGALGGNEKKEAFLRAIEDRDEAMDEEVDLLDGQGSQMELVPDSQPQQVLDELSQNVPAGKRKADTADYDGPFKRPRRPAVNAAFVKPASLADVRESVSFLVDEPHAQLPATTDDDDETEHTPEERPHYSSRRTPAPVVDRLLLRKTSSASTASTSGSGLAFLSRSSTSTSLFRPAMLAHAASSGAKRQLADGAKSEQTRPKGGKKSSIAYAAREAERRAVVDNVERRRKEDVKRIAGLRRGGGLIAWGGGGFE